MEQADYACLLNPDVEQNRKIFRGCTMLNGQCHCGAVRYEIDGEAVHSSICHCSDCRRSAGAPMVAWMAFAADVVRITGKTASYQSSPGTTRMFCANCGTGLFYVNEAVLPGLIDIQSATLDNPNAMPPNAHVQIAERLDWTLTMNDLPMFQRFPGG